MGDDLMRACSEGEPVRKKGDVFTFAKMVKKESRRDLYFRFSTKNTEHPAESDFQINKESFF